jgi:hypothetical protein
VIYLIWSLLSCSVSAETLPGQFFACAQFGLGSRWGAGIDFSLLLIFLTESLPPKRDFRFVFSPVFFAVHFSSTHELGSKQGFTLCSVILLIILEQVSA